MICHLIANSEYSTCLCVFWRNKRDGGNNCGGRGEGGFTGHRTGVTPLRAQLTASLTHTHTRAHKRPNSPHVKMHRDKQGFFFLSLLLFFLCKRENTFKQRCLAGHWKRTTWGIRRGKWSSGGGAALQHRHAGANRCALSVETKSRRKKSGRPEIPTRSLCLSSVLVVILQPGCQTVDPGEGMQSVHLHVLQTVKSYKSTFPPTKYLFSLISR